jgi:hypothetical protein
MREGPSSIRPGEDRDKVAARMQKHDLSLQLVTTSDGRLLGAVLREHAGYSLPQTSRRRTGTPRGLGSPGGRRGSASPPRPRHPRHRRWSTPRSGRRSATPTPWRRRSAPGPAGASRPRRCRRRTPSWINSESGCHCEKRAQASSAISKPSRSHRGSHVRSATQPLAVRPPRVRAARVGRYRVAVELRASGLIVHILASVYGEERGQGVYDEEWLALAGGRGWAVLMKDDSMRRRPAELAALHDAGVRAFCVTAQRSRSLRPSQSERRVWHSRGRCPGLPPARRSRRVRPPRLQTLPGCGRRYPTVEGAWYRAQTDEEPTHNLLTEVANGEARRSPDQPSLRLVGSIDDSFQLVARWLGLHSLAEVEQAPLEPLYLRFDRPEDLLQVRERIGVDLQHEGLRSLSGARQCATVWSGSRRWRAEHEGRKSAGKVLLLEPDRPES